MRILICLPAIALVVIGCGQKPDTEPEPVAGGNANFITAAEIDSSHAMTAYDAIQKLRSNFLTNRGSVTIKGTASPLPKVYFDGSLYGDPSTLKNISASQVGYIRMWRAWEAGSKFGSQNTAGVIEVVSRKQ